MQINTLATAHRSTAPRPWCRCARARLAQDAGTRSRTIRVGNKRLVMLGMLPMLTTEAQKLQVPLDADAALRTWKTLVMQNTATAGEAFWGLGRSTIAKPPSASKLARNTRLAQVACKHA